MRKVLFIFYLTPTFLYASGSYLHFINWFLYQSTIERCFYWTKTSRLAISSKVNSECQRTAKDFIQLLNIKAYKELPVVFPELVLKKLESEKTSAFLSTILKERDKLDLLENYEFSINQLITTWYPDHQEKMEILVALFQDTSIEIAHVNWAWSQKPYLSELQIKNIELLKKVFEYKLQNQSLLGGREAIYWDLGSYHKYVPEYVAFRLKQMHHPDWASFTFAYGFNFLYEVFSIYMKNIDKDKLIFLKDTFHQINFLDVFVAYKGILELFDYTPRWNSDKEFYNAFKKNRATFHHKILLDLGFSRCLEC